MTTDTLTVQQLDKIVSPGWIDIGRTTPTPIYCRIKWDGSRLSITGVEGPRRNGDCWGSCGQIEMGYLHRDPAHNDHRYQHPTVIAKYAEGWSEDLWWDFLEAWKTYHLNDMQAACEHQRSLGWTYEDHHGNNPDRKYEGDACPVCGYHIGSAWLMMEVPAEVIAFLEGLPSSSTSPAWV